MTKQTKNDISEAAGCLGSLPSRAGMSFLASRLVMKQLVMKQMATGGTMVVLDKGSSAEVMVAEIRRQEIEQAQRVMRIGRKCNDMPVVQPEAEPYYRQFDKRRP